MNVLRLNPALRFKPFVKYIGRPYKFTDCVADVEFQTCKGFGSIFVVQGNEFAVKQSCLVHKMISSQSSNPRIVIYQDLDKQQINTLVEIATRENYSVVWARTEQEIAKLIESTLRYAHDPESVYTLSKKKDMTDIKMNILQVMMNKTAADRLMNRPLNAFAKMDENQLQQIDQLSYVSATKIVKILRNQYK